MWARVSVRAGVVPLCVRRSDSVRSWSVSSTRYRFVRLRPSALGRSPARISDTTTAAVYK